MLFKRKRLQKEPTHMHSAVRKTAAYIDKQLHKFSNWEQKKTQLLSIKEKKRCLVVWCLLFISMSIYVFIEAFTNNKSIISVHQISVPSYSDKISDDLISGEPSISEKEFVHIKSFEKYMDSLKKSGTGKPLYDSIILARPGLMVSISLLENLYRNNH